MKKKVPRKIFTRIPTRYSKKYNIRNKIMLSNLIFINVLNIKLYICYFLLSLKNKIKMINIMN